MVARAGVLSGERIRAVSGTPVESQSQVRVRLLEVMSGSGNAELTLSHDGQTRQVDLDVRQNAHQSLQELGPMAYAVLQTVSARLQRDGRLQGPLPTTFLSPGLSNTDALESQLLERPPLTELRTAA